MAQRVQVQLIDDMNGQEAQETVPFSVDGTAYEIDLTTENAKELRDLLGMYVEKARKAKGGKSAQRSSALSASRDEAQRIRAWAQENGHAVNSRGRINREIQDAYHAAH